MMSVSIHQKETNKFMHIPYRSILRIKDKAEMLFSPSWLYAENEKVNLLF